MEFHGGGSGGVVVSGSNVPAFLTKLWTLVEDPETDPLICWSPNGASFHVFDQGRFSKEVLPKYFKHNNMASFVRQLNMYGFRKVVHMEQGGLVKPERDDTEFQHLYFLRGQEHLLDNIKRKVTNVSSLKQEDLKIGSDDVSKILNDVQHMRGKQESIDSKIIAMKHENEALWREVASLRQKHSQQQKVVNKLFQFLVTLVQSNRGLGMKRKIPLMLNDSSSSHSLPKFSRQFSLERLQTSPAISAPFSEGALSFSEAPRTGPIISDVTELAQPSPPDVTADWLEERTSPVPLVHIKEEPASPEVEEVCPVEEACSVEEACPVEGGAGGAGLSVDTPFSPTTFINSILQDDSAPNPAPADQRCLSVARLDHSQTSDVPRLLPSSSSSLQLRPHPGHELSDHLDSIDSGLENLQTILNAQSINFDSSPLFEYFSSSLSGTDFDLDTSLDSIQDLLSPDPPNGAVISDNSSNAGKQLVQYTATPMILSEPIISEHSGMDLPTLLELEGDTYFSPDPEVDSPISLLAPDYQIPDMPPNAKRS